MFWRKLEVEWVLLPEGERDRQSPPLSEPTNVLSESQKHQRLRRTTFFTIAITVFLLAGIGTAYAHHAALQGIETVEQEVRAAAEAEVWIQHNAPHLSAEFLVHDDASSYMKRVTTLEQSLTDVEAYEGAHAPTLQIQHTWFEDGTAASNLLITESATDGVQKRVYRQTRFYRETDKGWQRTQPAPALWGEPLSLETEHLTWHYRQRDHEAVTAIADESDALYVQLLHDYGLEHNPEAKVVINVQVEALPGLILLYDSPPGSIAVASPSVHLVPVDLTDADVLAQSIALALLKEMWARVVVQHRIEESWPLMAGVSLWEIWEMKLSLSEWRNEIVLWLFTGEKSNALSSEVKQTVRYREFCDVHRIWMTTPVAIGVPLHCNHMNGEASQKYVSLTNLKDDSIRRLQPVELHHTAQRPVNLWDSFMMYTIVDYSVATYGRERLPELVEALGKHATWKTLIPDVYGTSFEEFGEGWRKHVVNLAVTLTQ